MDTEDIPNRLNKRFSSEYRGWIIAIFSILGFLILLFVIELLLHAFGLKNGIRYRPVPSPDLFASEDTLGWVLRPDAGGPHVSYEYSVFYTIDDRGMRRTPASVDGNHPLICCLGGSMTFGHGLNDDKTIPNRLAELTGTEVWNLGVQGYATDQSLLQLQRMLRTSNPDIVILSYLPSHIERNAGLPKWTSKLRQSLRGKPQFRLIDGKPELTEIPGRELRKSTYSSSLPSEPSSQNTGFFLS